MSTSKFNPTPSASTSNADGASKTASLLDMPEEVLVPGALYTNCAVVVNLTVKLDNPDIQMHVNNEVKSGAETSTNKEMKREEVIELPDDGEYGGELAGRLVWEAYEAGLKVWERENARLVEEEGGIGDRKEQGGGRNTGKHDTKFHMSEEALSSLSFADLEETILLLRKSLSLCPVPHPDRRISLTHLGHGLWARFQRTDSMTDLEEAISMYRESLFLCPTSHPSRSSSLNNLANALQSLFQLSGDICNLEEAISMQKEVISIQES